MSRRAQLVVCALFLAAIFLPATVVAAGLVQPAFVENRPPAPVPPLGPVDLLHSETYTQLTEYLTDHVPWRDRAIRAREQFSLSVFDETTSESIIAGDGGWLYVAAPVRAPCFEPATLDRIGAGLRQLSGLVTGAGKQFRLLVVPDKDIAYPGHLHARDLRLSCHVANSVALRATSGGLRPGYSAVGDGARTDPGLYYESDEHWTARGATVGALELLASLAPGLVDPSAYRVEHDGDVRTGNLTTVQGLPRTEVTDAVVVTRPGVGVVSSDDTGSTPGAIIHREQRAGGPLAPGRTLVVADSFANALQPLVSPWLADVTWFSVVAGRYDPALLAGAFGQADTVVVVVVERNLPDRIDGLAAAARVGLGP